MRIRTMAQLGLVCLATVLMVCADAQAQRGGRGGGRGFGGGGFGRGGFGGGALAFIQRDDVQTELSLTDAQKDQIETIAEDVREANREAFQGFADLSDDERQELVTENQKRQDDAVAKAKDVLNANQAKRYGELELQFAVQQLGANKLDVNAQNEPAVEFYRRQGFEVYERTATDDQGRNYPLLRMRLQG